MDSSPIGGTVVQSLLWLAVCAAVLVILARVLARRFRPGQARSVVLTPQHCLHVVTVEGRRFLVGTGPAGPPSLIQELDGGVAVATQSPDPGAWTVGVGGGQ